MVTVLDLKRAEQEIMVLHEDVVTARKQQDALHSKIQYLERRLDQLGRAILAEADKRNVTNA